MAAPANLLAILEEEPLLKEVKQKRQTLENVSESPLYDFANEVNRFLKEDIEELIKQEAFREYADSYKNHITARTLSRLFNPDTSYPTPRVLHSLLLFLKVPFVERDLYLSDNPQYLIQIAQDRNIDYLPEIKSTFPPMVVNHQAVIENLCHPQKRWYSLAISTDINGFHDFNKVEESLRISSWVFFTNPHSDNIFVQVNNGYKLLGSFCVREDYTSLILKDSQSPIIKHLVLPGGNRPLAQQDVFLFISSVKRSNDTPPVPYFELLFSYENGPLSEVSGLQSHGWLDITMSEIVTLTQRDERIDEVVDHLKLGFP